LQWLVTNSRLDLAAPTSISQGNHSQGRVKHLQEANKLVRTAFATADTPIVFQSIPLDRLCTVTFHDAGQGSRPDGSSQGGYVTVLADKDILDGKECKVTIMDWRSFKLRRVARSSLSAEVQAFSEALDATEFLKIIISETVYAKGLDLRKADDYIRDIMPSCLVTDCKSLFDAVERSQSCGLNLSERRTAIEVLAARERLAALKIPVKWVNSDRQIADGLTKVAAAWKLQSFQQRPVIKLIWDPDFIAAKKIKASKAQPSTVDNVDTDDLILPPPQPRVHLKPTGSTTTKNKTVGKPTVTKRVPIVSKDSRETSYNKVSKDNKVTSYKKSKTK